MHKMETGHHLNATKLNIPLFFLSRNRIKSSCFSEVRNYVIKKSKTLYIPKLMDKGDESEDDNFDIEDKTQPKTITPPYLKYSNKRNADKSFKMAPNRYKIPSEQHCLKIPKWTTQVQVTVPRRRKGVRHPNKADFYEIASYYSNQTKAKCRRHKGIFLLNLRNQKPTSRFMVFDPITCWRNPNDPGPADYFFGLFDENDFPYPYETRAAPHRFYRNSNVPEIDRMWKAGLASWNFTPGPGRYELRDDEDSLTKMLEIEVQKRLKFRRIHRSKVHPPTQKINYGRRHIYGFGFTRLFRAPPTKAISKKQVSKKKVQRLTHEIQKYASFQYIRMITNPLRGRISFRKHQPPKKELVIHFNSLVKTSKRHLARENKKVVFGSGVPRFKDTDMPTAARKQTKPIKPVVNMPVMNVKIDEIKNKLDKLPERLRPIYKSNRVRPFKFRPMPATKTIMNETELRLETGETFEIYPKDINPNKYFKV